MPDLILDFLQVLILGYLVYKDHMRTDVVREVTHEVTVREVPMRRPRTELTSDAPVGPDRGATFKRKRPRWDTADARPPKR